MPRLAVEVRAPYTDDEVRRLTDIIYQSFAGFGQPPERTDAWLGHIGRPNLRVALRDGKVVGGLGLFYFDLYFGGRRIPATGVSAVGIAPDVRGDGVGTELMRGILREQARQGVPLSVLYPATYTLYRKVGYEVAGSRIMYKLELDTLGVHDRGLRIRTATAADEPAIEAVYLQRAIRSAGHPHRSPLQWRQILHFGVDRIFSYVIENTGGAVEGYIIFTQTGRPRAPYDLMIRDMAATTPAAARRLLAFLSSHSTMSGNAFYESGPADIVMSSARDEYVEIEHRILWMLRMVDARAALTQRGYPKGLRAKIEFELRDDLFRRNNGRFVLTVANGRGALSEAAKSPARTAKRTKSVAGGHSRARSGAEGQVRIDIRGLSALFSGLLAAEDLRVMGLVDGDEKSLSTASTIFAGPAPWMNDRF